MQFKIFFRVIHPGQLLPFSYQYELSAWIYRMISHGDSEFGKFLHSRGYASEKKRFKLFTFSSLYIPEFEPVDDRMKILCPEVSVVVSFLVEEAARDMIIGLFQKKELRLGDRISQVDLAVESVETLPSLTINTSTVRLKTTSPLLVSKPVELDNGKLRHEYLSPLHSEYEKYFIQNLEDKYHTAKKHKLAPPLTEQPQCGFHLLSEKPRMRGIRVKAFTPSETKIIGYMFDFELTAPSEIIRLGILAGFGGENAMGFGATKIIH
jgi:CRISPR-associated endoribonuclease Cas6